MGLIKKEIGPIKLEIFEGLSKSISFTDFCEPAGTMEFNLDPVSNCCFFIRASSAA